MTDTFYADVPIFRGFTSVMDDALYAPLPDGWCIGLADIVNSTGAIAADRYKAVNMAGAAVIASVTNALGGRDFPFVFGGDGASFAVPASDADVVRTALAATAAWVRDDLDLTMRVAMLSVADLRARGLDVLVARYGPSADVSYAMFSGGGLGWAEAAMKRGEFAIAPAAPGTHPDLAGLSCRFQEIPSSRGVILSVLVVPQPNADAARFRALVEDIVSVVERSPDAGRPVPIDGPGLRWPPKGLDYEARGRRGGSLLKRRAAVLVHTFFAYIIMRFRIRVGNFDPNLYIAQLVQNSDFRKYDDGLRMVVDCPPALETALELRLQAAAQAGIARYGLHRQDAALMTCFTPSAMQRNHVHFIDGARGGYASAAVALKGAQAHG